MEKLTSHEQDTLGEILFEAYKKQIHKIDGHPEEIESIVRKYCDDNHAMFKTILYIEEYRELVEDDKSDYSGEDSSELPNQGSMFGAWMKKDNEV
jgi:hypothetical protein